MFDDKKKKPIYLEKYPIEAMISMPPPYLRTVKANGEIEKPELDLFVELLQLGAKAECPEPNRSYLFISPRADYRLLLLQHGADPNKIIDVKEKIPVYATMFIDPRFEGQHV